MKIFCFVFAAMKTDTFENALVWMELNLKAKNCKASHSVKCINHRPALSRSGPFMMSGSIGAVLNYIENTIVEIDQPKITCEEIEAVEYDARHAVGFAGFHSEAFLC